MLNAGPQNNYDSKMKSLLLGIYFIFALLPFVSVNAAVDDEVAVESNVIYSTPYKQRRSTHGILFGVSSEKFYPKEMLSLLDDASIDQILDKKPIDLLNISLGYKYNFNLGALSLVYSFSEGSGSGRFNNAQRKIHFQKQNISVGYYADNVLSEPWVVPYGQAGLNQFSMTEEESNAAGEQLFEDSQTTDFSLMYSVGLLFQLNWIEGGIDANTHADGLRSSGLENTFLDIYFSWHQPAQKLYDPNNRAATLEDDPNLSAEAQLGVGLKLEF